MEHLKYRTDIDGLRAIAILAVVGYHAFPSSINGGFVGVDIFFVISGFLISSIIFSNLNNNQFSYYEFYARRIKRILPALIIVLISTLIIGWYMLLPGEFKQLGKHVAGGGGFISNFILLGEAGYFDNASETKPLLHLWSLGIEEQFYLFWPVVLVAAWKTKCNLLTTTFIIGLISFTLNIYILHSFSSISAFYLPISRFWELMIGGGLAYISIYKGHYLQTNKFYVNIFSIFGITLILISIFTLDKNKDFPGIWALLPTIGTFLLIASPTSMISQHILSHQKLVFIGLISYPLYLWHWALLSFFFILGYNDQASKTIIIISSILLAWLTYEKIERNIRKFSIQNLEYKLLFLLLILFFTGFLIYQGVLTPRNTSKNSILSTKAFNDWEYPNGLKPNNLNGVNTYIKTGTEKKVLFFGDSRMEQYAPRIVKLINQAPDKTKSAIFATSGGCPPIPSVYEDKHPGCNVRFKKVIIEYALSDDIDSVVIGGAWRHLAKSKKPANSNYRYYYLLNGRKFYLDEDGITYATQSLEQLLTKIAKLKKVFLVLDNPTWESFNPKLSISRLSWNYITDKTNYFYEYNEEQARLRKQMIEMANRANAIIIDPVTHFCKGKQCRAILDDGTPIYKDSSHLRSSYTKQFADFMDLTVKN